MIKTNTENGFIPMIIALVIVVVAVIWFIYERVANAH
jgi:cbb3-type cytochrome oxidase subunit 3